MIAPPNRDAIASRLMAARPIAQPRLAGRARRIMVVGLWSAAARGFVLTFT